MKIATALASTGLALTMLTGCGGGGDDFCGQVEDVQSQFDDIDGDQATLDDLRDAGGEIGDLAADAPEGLSSDLEDASSSIDSFVGTLEDADVPTDVPLDEALGDIDPAAAADLQGSLTEINSLPDTLDKVTTGIDDECDIDLGDSSS